jgi:hypothetical protein
MSLNEIEFLALHQLRSHLDEVSDRIRTGELKWYFDVRLFELEERVSDIRPLIKAAYPRSCPEKAEIRECSLDDILETLGHELGRFIPALIGMEPLAQVVSPYSELWKLVEGCIDFWGARFFEYLPSDHLDEFGKGGIIGNFAFVILNDSQRRCLMWSGGDCD